MNRTEFSRRQLLLGFGAALAAGDWFGSGALAAMRDVPWLEEVQQPPRELPADAPKLSPLQVDAAGKEITTFAGWQARRAELRRWWLEYLHPWAAAVHGPPRLHVVAEDRPEGAIRQLVEYEAEPGVIVEAYVLKPREQTGRRPGVLVFHPTVDQSIREPAGKTDAPARAFGLELARRGCVALCPRNFLWPQTDKLSADAETRRFFERHPGSLGMAKMLFDGRTALDILAAMPEVDPERLGAIGHSLGAKQVLYLAAFDERVRAAVSSEGGIGLKFSNWEAPWYLGPKIQEASFKHEHHELLGLAAPRPFLLVGGDSADGARSWPFIAAAMPVYKLYAAEQSRRDSQKARVNAAAIAPPPASRIPLGLLNHRQGHSVPAASAARMYDWLTDYLG